MATVHLVDASPYIFRAHFSLPGSIRTPDGRPAAAAYGFTSFLLKLIADERPTYLGVAFDRNLNGSFRNDFYPAYKQHRVAPPPELEAQIDVCMELAAALGAATFIDDRYEADDLIGTLCARLEEAGHGAVIVTSDKDLAQLVTDRTSLFDFAKEIRFTAETVREKFGVRPDQMTDFLGLAGDTVDNIPGVKGIGATSAGELLARFGHLEELYERLDELLRLPIRGAKSLHAKLAASRGDRPSFQAARHRRAAGAGRDRHPDQARAAWRRSSPGGGPLHPPRIQQDSRARHLSDLSADD